MKQKFRHIVGKSTLQEGITVHRNFEVFFNSPEPGSKREITLQAGNELFKASIRRLNNQRKHVHIDYKKKEYHKFLDWLNDTCKYSADKRHAGLIEFEKISVDNFKVKIIPDNALENAHLHVAQHFGNNTDSVETLLVKSTEEISSIIISVKYDISQNQSYYNSEIKKSFISNKWDAERCVAHDLNLKYDFRKDKTQVEVEFGNARSYYQDFIKFEISRQSGDIDLGILIAPTYEFAGLLCEVGLQNAIKHGGKSYSGMMTFDKTQNEFKYLKNIFTMPLAIIGVDIDLQV